MLRLIGRALFTPRRVAVVGASASPGKAGALFLRNLTAVEADSPAKSLRSIRRPARIPVVQPIPVSELFPAAGRFRRLSSRRRAAVPDIIAECGASGVPVAVVISGGFAETGPRGVELQREVAEDSGCTWSADSRPELLWRHQHRVGLQRFPIHRLARARGISLLTQSGAYGMAAYSQLDGSRHRLRQDCCPWQQNRPRRGRTARIPGAGSGDEGHRHAAKNRSPMAAGSSRQRRRLW